MVVCLALLRAAARPLPTIEESPFEEASTFVLAEPTVPSRPEPATLEPVATLSGSRD